MDAEILAVGTELLMGQIANTNAQYISGRLQDIGINVFYHSVVGDNPERLRACLQIALNRSDSVIMTGGLGPTQDDLTKETVTDIVGRKLVLHEPSRQRITDIFQRTGWTMTDANLKQAYLPEGSMVINNDHGTAPGCIIEKDNKVLIMLPGPPSEMKPMFEQSVVPYLEGKSGYRIVSKYLNIVGIGESYLETQLMDLIDGQTNPTIATYAKEGEVTVRLTARLPKDDTTDLIAPLEAIIRERVGNAIYSTGFESIEEVVGRLLQDNNLSLAIAETVAGGTLASNLCMIPEIPKGRFHSMTVDHSGSIDQDSAINQAQTIREFFDTDLGVAVIGSIGEAENNGLEQTDTVYIALASRNKDNPAVIERHLFGDVNRKRHSAVLHVLDMIRNYILNMPETNKRHDI
ncbi:competence/damage-inducible protein A [Dehalobacter sp. DCM]|uniref:competence/damage-inducible protein A n=1 Tax=Dehalobacter sp. DCM TaxID=2907827 RepID=UPI0030812006|nr:competence/damage-inducible protein A [Dehalobacter sp. DCM]